MKFEQLIILETTSPFCFQGESVRKTLFNVLNGGAGEDPSSVESGLKVFFISYFHCVKNMGWLKSLTLVQFSR